MDHTIFPSILPTEDRHIVTDEVDPETALARGECPWCPPDDRYEGDAIPQHASSAHPREWAEYRGED